MPLDKDKTLFNNITMATKKITTMYLDEDVYQKAKVFAVKQKKSVSEITEAALLFFIKNHDKIKTE